MTRTVAEDGDHEHATTVASAPFARLCLSFSLGLHRNGVRMIRTCKHVQTPEPSCVPGVSVHGAHCQTQKKAPVLCMTRPRRLQCRPLRCDDPPSRSLPEPASSNFPPVRQTRIMHMTTPFHLTHSPQQGRPPSLLPPPTSPSHAGREPFCELAPRTSPRMRRGCHLLF